MTSLTKEDMIVTKVEFTPKFMSLVDALVSTGVSFARIESMLTNMYTLDQPIFCRGVSEYLLTHCVYGYPPNLLNGAEKAHCLQKKIIIESHEVNPKVEQLVKELSSVSGGYEVIMYLCSLFGLTLYEALYLWGIIFEVWCITGSPFVKNK